MDIFIHVAIASTIAIVAMTLAFAFSVRLNFYSFVDAVWAFCFGLIAIAFAFYAENVDQHYVFYGLVILWSLRLGSYILARLIYEYPKEDTRYTNLKVKWGESVKPRFAVFFGFQAASVVLLSTPILLVASNPDGHIGLLAKCGVVLWFVGILGEAIADAQLRAFKMDEHNKGKVCEVGLWSLSRHPNYFFEWIIWCGFGVYALAAPYGYFGLIAPAFMFYLLNFVSGIPLAEAQSLKSKGDLYADYQRRTSSFFPWIPRR